MVGVSCIAQRSCRFGSPICLPRQQPHTSPHLLRSHRDERAEHGHVEGAERERIERLYDNDREDEEDWLGEQQREEERERAKRLFRRRDQAKGRGRGRGNGRPASRGGRAGTHAVAVSGGVAGGGLATPSAAGMGAPGAAGMSALGAAGMGAATSVGMLGLSSGPGVMPGPAPCQGLTAPLQSLQSWPMMQALQASGLVAGAPGYAQPVPSAVLGVATAGAGLHRTAALNQPPTPTAGDLGKVGRSLCCHCVCFTDVDSRRALCARRKAAICVQ